MTEWIEVASLRELEEERPASARVLDVDLVVVREGAAAHVLHSRCAHRGADLAKGTVEGGCLVCPEHGWEFDCATGASPTLSGEGVRRFASKVERDRVLVDADELRTFLREHEQEPDYTL